MNIARVYIILFLKYVLPTFKPFINIPKIIGSCMTQNEYVPIIIINTHGKYIRCTKYDNYHRVKTKVN